MATVDRVAAPATARAERVRTALLALGLTQLGLGAFMALAPGTFFDTIADYGTRNDHYLRDLATFYLALGVVLMVASDRRSWRAPVLAFAVIQYGLHTLNHLLDIGDADPGWIGPFNFVSLAVFTALFVYVLRAQAQLRR